METDLIKGFEKQLKDRDDEIERLRSEKDAEIQSVKLAAKVEADETRIANEKTAKFQRQRDAKLFEELRQSKDEVIMGLKDENAALVRNNRAAEERAEKMHALLEGTKARTLAYKAKLRDAEEIREWDGRGREAEAVLDSVVEAAKAVVESQSRELSEKIAALEEAVKGL